MSGAYFLKANNSLIPASDSDAEILGKIKAGEAVRIKFTRARNYQFHKKFMALMNLAFDYWPEPNDEDTPVYLRNTHPQKNFDRFRKDITILAGYYESTFRLNGDVRIEAKSISFASMDEDEFEKLYSDCIDVVLKKVCTHYSEDALRSVVDQVMGFS